MYIQHMSPFFFNLLSEFFEAASYRHSQLEPEDVHVLRELGELFEIRRLHSKNQQLH